MSTIDEKSFASGYIKKRTYWDPTAIQTGSSYFQTNPKKLTRQSFDELIQTIDDPVQAINQSTLLSTEAAKSTYSKHLLKDLSNIEDIATISEFVQSEVTDGLGIMDTDTYTKEVADLTTKCLPEYTTSTIDGVEVTFEFDNSVIIKTSQVNPVIITKSDIDNKFELTDDSYTYYSIDLENGDQYYYIFGELVSSEYPEAIAILQTLTKYHSGLAVSLTFELDGIKTCTGEIVLQSANGSCTRHVTGATISDTNVKLKTIYFPYEISQNHTHYESADDTSKGYRYVTSDTRNIERMPLDIEFISYTQAIARAFVGLGRIGYILQGIRNVE